MDILARAYDDDSNTPKFELNREDSSERSPHHMPEAYRKRTDSLQSGSASDKASKNSRKRPSSAASAKDSDSDSSDSDDESASDENKKIKGTTAHMSSGSSDVTSLSSSPSVSDRSDGSKKSAKVKEVKATGKDRKTSSSSKVSSRRSRSRSLSKGRRRRRSSDRRRRSRSRDRHHKSSRSERKSGRRSRSRSRSRDRHSRHHSRDHRRRESHRRRRSSSRDGHRHRRRSSPGRRHRRHSRSPDHKKSHRSEKKRSRSPQPSSSSKPENSAITVTTAIANPGSSRPPVIKVAGVKFNRGRGTSTGTFKDMMREEYKQQVQQAVDVVAGKSQPMTTGLSHLTSSVATVSAGTGVMGSGGLNQVLVNQMQLHLQQQQQYLPGQPGCLTPAQKELNQKYLLHSIGRTREQVEKEFGVKLSTKYNEATNNMVELAQREKKKGLLWKNPDKKKSDGNSVFKAIAILPGQSKSENQKFARLMGCRKGEPKEEQEEDKPEDQINPEVESVIAESRERNSRLELEFENSRRFTHVNRGIGFGYPNTTTMFHQSH